MRRMIGASLAIVSATLALRSAGAQWSVGIGLADSLLASGHVATAESLYYAASSARPHDATARAALGRYLASRGALKIGAVLLEEARLFGGDTASIARSLAPIYGSLGDYRSLATLPASPLSSPQRDRVRWLVSHPPVLEFADPAAALPYRPLLDGSGIGVVTIGIGERRLDAIIDPRVAGVVVRGRAARRRDGLRAFGEDSSGVIAVVRELHLGDVTLSNVAARIVSDSADSKSGGHVVSIVGLDVLQRLAPTFDPAAKAIVFHRTGQIPSSLTGTRLPMLLDGRGFRVLTDGQWAEAGSGATTKLLAARMWTLDAKRGAIIVQ
jgi:hypothetical protein